MNLQSKSCSYANHQTGLGKKNSLLNLYDHTQILLPSSLILQTNTLEKLSSKLVFTRASYNRTGNYLAAATLNGDILIINFAIEKFWLLSHLNSCTALKFSTLSDTQIVAGLRDGCVKVFDVDNAIQIADLKNHTYHVNKISFSTTKECLTGSKLEAVIWDMRTWCVIRILTLERNCFIKDIMFVPVTGDILACFHDDIIHVWKGRSYDNFKQILPAQWNKVSVKSIAVTRYLFRFLRLYISFRLF